MLKTSFARYIVADYSHAWVINVTWYQTAESFLSSQIKTNLIFLLKAVLRETQYKTCFAYRLVAQENYFVLKLGRQTTLGSITVNLLNLSHN